MNNTSGSLFCYCCGTTEESLTVHKLRKEFSDGHEEIEILWLCHDCATLEYKIQEIEL